MRAHISPSFFLLSLVIFGFIEANAIPNNNKKKRIVIVKIGGSSITEKAQLETLNPTALEWFAQTIQSSSLSSTHSKIKNKNGDDSDNDDLKTQFVIVHGAGSFGHYHAKEFGFRGVTSSNVNKSFSNNPKQIREGISKTRLSVQTLHLHVLSSLVQHDVPAVGISPFATSPIYEQDLDLTSLSASVLRALEQDMVPVIHGDAVFHDESIHHYRGSGGILGGDDIVYALATYLVKQSDPATTAIDVVFITDVDGVFTSDPKSNPNAQLVPVLEISSEGAIVQKNVEASKSSHDHDVTGGLESKLKSAIQIAQQGMQVIIVKCQSQSAAHAVQGLSFQKGTTIQLLSASKQQSEVEACLEEEALHKDR